MSDTSFEWIETLESFFELVDSRVLFRWTDGERLRRLREDVADAVGGLLVWGRPELEAAEGIMWPYEELRARHGVFSDAAALEGRGEDGFLRRQAMLFLAFLPFPSMWRRLLDVEREFANDPEVVDYLASERRKIDRKLAGRGSDHSRLRHFCQVLKGYRGEREKGVLRIFSLPYLFADPVLLSRLGRRYVLFVEPPMGVVFRHGWWRRFTMLEDPVLFGLSSKEDRDFASTHSNVEVTELAHGDFLNDDAGEPPVPGDPGTGAWEYDIVFNSAYDDMDRKRHELMLRLLLHPLLKGRSALFLGRGDEARVEAARAMVRGMGLDGRVTVLSNLRRRDVPRLLQKCGIGVHLSLYENGCRGIYEFFRSNLPCVISSSMGGVNLDIFNSLTGTAVPDAELPEAIHFALTHRESFEPRRWFMRYSGSAHSSMRLNAVLKDLFARRGYSWNSDIVALGSSGAGRYIDRGDEERFRDDLSWLGNLLGATGDKRLVFSST